jgi:CheY-like chemotaxis protein
VSLVLIVEDDEANMKLARNALRARGYQTIEAWTGEEGVKLAQERKPGLVLMDIQLPGIDGIEALRRLRADPATRAIPVLALSASLASAQREAIAAAGFDAFLPKPFRLKEFVATVSRLLR